MVQIGNSSTEPISYNIGNISNYKSNLPYSSSSSHISNCYLTDSRAHDRICSSLHFWDIFYRIKTLNVHLPNGSWFQIKYEGNVQISPFIFISIVFVFRCFQNQLDICIQTMSVPKHFNQIHTNSLLFLQDMKSTKMISLVVQVNRLYKLTRSHKHAQAHDLPFICKYVKHIDSLLSFHTIP